MASGTLQDGIAALRAQRYDQAERIARDLLSSTEPTSETYNVLGCALIYTSRMDEGIKYIGKAAELSASTYSYARNLISLSCRQGRFDDARMALERFSTASSDAAKIADLRYILDHASGLTPADHSRTFEEIYRSNAWNSGSGLGSTPEATQVYRDFLQNFIRLNAITSVVDLGCGDWSFSRLIEWTGVDYTGVDVSETVLARARQHQSDTIRFVALNAMTDPLPPADLLIVKDVPQHWPNRDVLHFLDKLKTYPRALITNRFSAERSESNHDIRLGDVRAINLVEHPFEMRGSNVLHFRADTYKAVFLWQK